MFGALLGCPKLGEEWYWPLVVGGQARCSTSNYTEQSPQPRVSQSKMSTVLTLRNHDSGDGLSSAPMRDVPGTHSTGVKYSWLSIISPNNHVHKIPEWAADFTEGSEPWKGLSHNPTGQETKHLTLEYLLLYQSFNSFAMEYFHLPSFSIDFRFLPSG